MVSPDQFVYERDFATTQTEQAPLRLAKPDGKKKSYGMEITFQKKAQQGLYYAVGYSLSSVMDKYADGEWYDNAENVRNHGSFLLGMEFLKRHSISGRVYFSEGRPYSPITTDKQYGYQMIDTTKRYFSQRLDPVVSVNLRYNFRFYPTFGTVTGYIEAWNLFNYRPVIKKEPGWSQEALGIIPFLGLTADF